MCKSSSLLALKAVVVDIFVCLLVSCVMEKLSVTNHFCSKKFDLVFHKSALIFCLFSYREVERILAFEW